MKAMVMDMDPATVGGEVAHQGQEDPDPDTGTGTEDQGLTMTDTMTGTAETAEITVSDCLQGPAAAPFTLTPTDTMVEKKQTRRSVHTPLRSGRRIWRPPSSVTIVSSGVLL